MCLRDHTRPAPPRLYRLYDDDPYGFGGRPPRAGFHTSRIEVTHLVMALIMLSFAFTLCFTGMGIERVQGPFIGALPIEMVAIMSMVAVGTGFLLHELMHKFVAQYFGHWAEFRAQAFGLLLPIPLILLTGWILALPGAVVIAGYVAKNQNGMISAAGPATNLAIGYLALPFALVPDATSFGAQLGTFVGFVNGILALFNMLPIFILDGRKVLRWNWMVFSAIWILGILLLALLTFGLP
jgi:Zn-dependent protease